jgi:hypothetical protein
MVRQGANNGINGFVIENFPQISGGFHTGSFFCGDFRGVIRPGFAGVTTPEDIDIKIRESFDSGVRVRKTAQQLGPPPPTADQPEVDLVIGRLPEHGSRCFQNRNPGTDSQRGLFHKMSPIHDRFS